MSGTGPARGGESMAPRRAFVAQEAERRWPPRGPVVRPRDWLRRLWGQRLQPLPHASKLDLNRLRRIAYL
jgi:hypothetical protein